MKIIITGSLGHIGKPLTEKLVQTGHDVTVVSSNPKKQAEIEGLGASAAIGTLEDVEFLVSAFDGADAVFAMVPPNYGAPDVRVYYQKLARNYAAAITRAGVKRVVHLSSYGADLDRGTGFILGAHDAEGILNELSDVALTHLRPTYFYYNLSNFADMIKESGFIGTNYGGDDKILLVAPVDIAAVAAQELTEAAHGTTVRYLASDERTADEIARVLGAAINKPDLKWVTFSDEETKRALEGKGMPPHIADAMVELGASIHSGVLRADYDQHQPTTMGKVKLEDFAQEFATNF